MSGGGEPAVFLDRDNTLIHNAGDLGDPKDVELVQGAAMAVASLRGLGFRVVGVTNQGGVARGKYGEDDVERVHARIDALLEHGANGAALAGWYFCPYHPRGTDPAYTREHPDRKPAPGMLLRAAEDLGIDLARSWMVGDAFRDTQAGAAAGCRTVLLHPESGRLSPERMAELAEEEAAKNAGGDPAAEAAAAAHRPDFVAATLVEAVRVIASQRHTERGRSAAADARVVKPEGKPAARSPSKAFRPMTLGPEEEAKPLVEPRAKVQSSAVLERAKPAVERAIQRARGKEEPADRDEKQPKTPAVRGAPDEPQPQPQQPPAPEATKLLGQIHRELRAGRGTGGDASAATIVAWVLQSIAAVSLLGALWMAGDNDGVFLRWGVSALFFQGATIATLLLQRR